MGMNMRQGCTRTVVHVHMIVLDIFCRNFDRIDRSMGLYGYNRNALKLQAEHWLSRCRCGWDSTAREVQSGSIIWRR